MFWKDVCDFVLKVRNMFNFVVCEHAHLIRFKCITGSTHITLLSTATWLTISHFHWQLFNWMVPTFKPSHFHFTASTTDNGNWLWLPCHRPCLFLPAYFSTWICNTLLLLHTPPPPLRLMLFQWEEVNKNNKNTRYGLCVGSRTLRYKQTGKPKRARPRLAPHADSSLASSPSTRTGLRSRC